MKNNNSERIRKYLEGLDPEQKRKFESDLQENEELSDRFLETVVKKWETDRLKRRIRENAGRAQHPRTIRLNRPGILAWASILIVLLVPSIFILINFFSEGKDIFTEEHLYYPAPGTIRGIPSENVNRPDILAEAFRSYSSGKFKKAHTLFERVIETGGADPGAAIHMYAGISQLRSGTPDHELTEDHFRKVLKTGNEYNQAARWFLALTLYEAGKTEEAKVIFSAIAEDEGAFNSVKAAGILNKFYE